MQRHRWIAVLASTLLTLVLTAGPARAQMRVIDPANLVQSVLQAKRALEQIHNQVQQIEQQAQMLASNPLQLSGELSASISQARQLFDAARGIAFEVESLSEDIAALYPETWQDFDLGSIGEQTEQWLAEDRASLERAMRVEAQAVQSIEIARGRLDRALAASAGAEGQTGAVQASNQLLGINAAQLAEIHALLIAQSRALTTERLERVGREERAREVQRRAFPTEATRTLDPARTAF